MTPRPAARTFRPHLEYLETRDLPSAFTVDSLADSGAGSLRQAILDSNANPWPLNTIAFNIGGGGVQTITPLSALPAITKPVVLDGTSQPGFTGTPLIVLDGSAAGTGADGLSITAGNSTVEGLAVVNFQGSGIALQAGGADFIAGNYIGVDSTGAAAGNGGHGISITGGSSNNTIGGTTAAARNVISGNTAHGVFIAGSDATGNLVEGNYIGTDATGTAAVANGGNGIEISGAPNNRIGGTCPGARNILSGNTLLGVFVRGDGASGNVIEGNYIGTDVSGTVAVANENDGVQISDGAQNNTLGGTDADARNVISGNALGDVWLRNAGTSGNVVEGNYIGTDASGLGTVGNLIYGESNQYWGIRIDIGAGGNTIGGTSAGAGNVISFRADNGVSAVCVLIRNAGTSGNVVEGNYIGTDATGTAILVNSQTTDGVLIDGGAGGNTIGSASAGAPNVISGLTLGVFIPAGAGAGNVVQGSYIGTDASGTVALGNSTGVYIGGPGNTIGGTTAAAGNVISGNSADGVSISGSGATGNLVEGNYIGTDVTGTAPLGNGGNGVLVALAANNTIGGTATGAGNVIANNGNDGVLVNAGTGNAIRANSIFSNTNLGIELVNNGNRNQAAPVLTSATSGGGITTIQGTLQAAPNATFTVDLFANADGDGQGGQFLGCPTVTTDASGQATFTVSVDGEVPPGESITATATDPGNNTSAFSQPVAVTGSDSPGQPAPDPQGPAGGAAVPRGLTSQAWEAGYGPPAGPGVGAARQPGGADLYFAHLGEGATRGGQPLEGSWRF
jgi:titin